MLATVYMLQLLRYCCDLGTNLPEESTPKPVDEWKHEFDANLGYIESKSL